MKCEKKTPKHRAATSAALRINLERFVGCALNSRSRLFRCGTEKTVFRIYISVEAAVAEAERMIGFSTHLMSEKS